MKRANNFTIKITILAGLIAGIAGVTPVLRAALGSDDSEPVSKLLSQARAEAYQIQLDAGTLESFTREPNISWQNHAEFINLMKANINEEGKTVAKLVDARSTASPWQVTAIDRIVPLLKELAANTTNAIAFINKNPAKLFSDEYKDYLEANADVSTELSDLITHYVHYGNTKNRFENLSRKLELPAK